MATSFKIRQFYNVPSSYGTFTAPSGVYVVTGSESRLLVNKDRQNLASDSMTITTQYDGPYVANSGTITGWWPGASTDWIVFSGEIMPGIIVGGADDYANTSPDGRTSRVSVYGFSAIYEDPAPPGQNQQNLDNELINLVNYILGTSWGSGDLVDAKQSLINAGFYYQYPAGFNGQSPNTGAGSDIL